MSISKRVVLIGPTGGGKSWLGNELLNRNAFKSSASAKSETDAISEATNEIILKDNKKLILTVVDTPGIGDTKGRSKEFLDEIVTYIKTKGVNMLFIVLPFKRIDKKGLENNLLALEECINGYYNSSTVLIINQIPTDYQLKSNNPPQTLKDIEDEAKKDFAEKLKTMSLATNIFMRLQVDENEDFKKLMETMYAAIVHSTNVPSNILRTWTETLAFYEGVVYGNVSAKESLDNDIARKSNQLIRLEDDKEACDDGLVVALSGQAASIGLVFTPVVGPFLAAGVSVACGAMAIYLKTRANNLAEEILDLHIEIESLRLKTPNAQEEVDKATAKLAEIGNYL